MEHLENDNTTLSIPINRTTCILFYLSRVLNLDLPYLYFLYKKFGEDMFYFFFMMSGKKMSIPREDRLVNHFKNADIIYEKITKNPNKVIDKPRDLDIYHELIDFLDNDTMEIDI